MTSLSDATAGGPKIMAIGKPGTGKTGALASLPPAGYSLYIIDFDGNLDPLAAFLDKKYHKMVRIKSLEDKLRHTPKGVRTSGVPEAFSDAMDMMDNGWTDDDGFVVPPVRKFGPKDVLVIDSLTAMGRAAMRLQLAINNRVAVGPSKRDWQLAQMSQEGMVEVATSALLTCPVYITSHEVLIGPKEVEAGDDDTTKKVRAAAAEVVPHKLFPSALGRALPQSIAQHFPVVLEFLSDGRPSRRIIRTVPSPELEITKVPAKGIPRELPLESGLARIFEALA